MPVVLLAWLGWRKRDALGAAGAVAAFAIRELAALLFVGGALAALRSRDRAVRPWLVGIAVGAALYTAHAAAIAPLLVAHGHETPLHGPTPAARSLSDMLAFQLPLAPLTGPILLGVALFAAWQRDEFMFLAPYAALPLLGLVADRPYWGAMVVPVLLVSALDIRLPARNARERRPSRRRAAGETESGRGGE